MTTWAGQPLNLDSDGTVLAVGDPTLHIKAMEILAG